MIDKSVRFLGYLLCATLLLATALSSARADVIELRQTVEVPAQVRALPGGLDDTPMFNSNSPEVVGTEGILLSCFPPSGKACAAAHLNSPVAGNFTLFLHHINNRTAARDVRTLYIGVLAYNPDSAKVRVRFHEAASYLSQPDAPFITMPSFVDNKFGNVYAGPGDRVANEVLRGQRQAGWPRKLTLAPLSYQMLAVFPVPVAGLDHPVNGRTALARLTSNGPLYLASLAMFADRPPALAEWVNLLKCGNLSTPRDKEPTAPDAKGAISYGRVAGIARGAYWEGILTDGDLPRLKIPAAGQSYSYVLSTVAGGTFGTQQVQSAPLMVRYPDTAYAAHGNYGVEYDLSLPLFNNTNEPKIVQIALETPLKDDKTTNSLRFTNPPYPNVFFRGTVRLRYTDDRGLELSHYIHLVERRGEKGEPLATLRLKPGHKRNVDFEFIYPPDATPPQILTIKTLAENDQD